MNYLAKHGSTRRTPQDEPISPEQVENRAGGFAWELSPLDRFKRFLILGAEGGTFYVDERKLVRDNVAVLGELAANKEGIKAVEMILEVSVAGRAKSNDQALFALAYFSVKGDLETRRFAYAALPEVARISTHLFHFLSYRELFGGWSRGLRSAVARWYNEKNPEQLAYQLVKYRQRDGWTHRDVLRLAHPVAADRNTAGLFKFAVEGDTQGQPPLIVAFGMAQDAVDPRSSARLIKTYGLPREAIKPDHLKSVEVWETLLPGMPMEAMVRNLSVMTRNGTLKPLGKNEKLVAEKLVDLKQIKRSRIHPLSVLNATVVYANGGRIGYSRGEPFVPSDKVVEALETTFLRSFENVVPAGKRFLLGLDVSGSMTSPISGSQVLSCRDASAAMALITAETEPETHAVAFTRGPQAAGYGNYGGWRDNAVLQPFPVQSNSTVFSIVERMGHLQYGGTDCALPMLYATDRGLEVDCFVIYTDNETWAGNIHPAQALREYRKKSGIDARLVVVGMTSDGFSIADPNDRGMLDVVGFDTATPNLISAFARGDF